MVLMNAVPIFLSLCSVVIGDTDPNGLVTTGQGKLKKALRLFVMAEMVNAGIAICVIAVLSSLGPIDIISDPLSFFLDIFCVLSLGSVVLVSNRYGLVSTGGSAKGPGVDLLEAEVDASADKVEGLEYTIGYIRAHRKKPEDLVSSFLQHMALRDDDAGKRARELLDESKSN